MKRVPNNIRSRRSLGVAFVKFELALLLGSFGFFTLLNRNLEFRYRIYRTFPSIVEGYYKAGEFMDPECSIRQNDQKYWKSKGKDL